MVFGGSMRKLKEDTIKQIVYNAPTVRVINLRKVVAKACKWNSECVPLACIDGTCQAP